MPDTIPLFGSCRLISIFGKIPFQRKFIMFLCWRSRRPSAFRMRSTVSSWFLLFKIFLAVIAFFQKFLLKFTIYSPASLLLCCAPLTSSLRSSLVCFAPHVVILFYLLSALCLRCVWVRPERYLSVRWLVALWAASSLKFDVVLVGQWPLLRTIELTIVFDDIRCH